MADLTPLVQKYIGPINKPKHLNYYSALGLAELTEDRSAIALAIEVAIEKLKRADRSHDPKGFEEVVKIVRHARVTLLDGEKKAPYDTQLKSLLRKVAPSVLGEDSQLLTESARLKELLPSGDPSAPFSLTDFLKSRPEDIEYETVAQRQDALRPLLAANPFDMTGSQSKGLSSPVAEPASQPALLQPGLLPLGAAKSSRSQASSSKSLQEELLRNRRQKNLISGGIAIGGACVLVGFGLWMFMSSRAQQQEMLAQRAANENAIANQQQAVPVNNPIVANQTNSASPNKLGSPKLGKQEPKRMNLGIRRDANSSSTDSATPMQLPTVGAGDASANTSEKTTESPAMNAQPTAMPTDIAKEMPINQSMNEAKPASKPSMESKKSESWSIAMNAALNAIKKRDTKLFETEMEKAFAATEDPQRIAQSESLNFMGQLVPMSEKAFSDAYASLRATNAISLGSSGQASIVEVTPESLVMRIKGNNERFEFDELPMEWVLEIANLELSDTPIDDAVRGTLLQWNQRATAESKTAAKKFFDKASSKDKKFSNLDGIINRQYK
ncbi:MAG: hypothetical protein NTW52_02625 [Planctomycetota bacterium]|nr:hypothetical protein [Planctomycetota bacterium]